MHYSLDELAHSPKNPIFRVSEMGWLMSENVQQRNPGRIFPATNLARPARRVCRGRLTRPGRADIKLQLRALAGGHEQDTGPFLVGGKHERQKLKGEVN